MTLYTLRNILGTHVDTVFVLLKRCISRSSISRSMLPIPFLIWIIICCGITACGINTRDEAGIPVRLSTEEFSAYVERVFRHHNGVVNELILATSLSDDPDLMLPTTLLSAERKMVANCQALNEMVSATIEGRELSLWKKLLLTDQLPACSESSHQVEALIEKVF